MQDLPDEGYRRLKLEDVVLGGVSWPPVRLKRSCTGVEEWRAAQRTGSIVIWCWWFFVRRMSWIEPKTYA